MKKELKNSTNDCNYQALRYNFKVKLKLSTHITRHILNLGV